MTLSPKASGNLIASLAQDVRIKSDGIIKLGDEIVRQIESGQLCVENFSQNGLHPAADDPNALDWILVVDTLNFCFWSLEKQEGWKVNNYTGYFALCSAINRAVEENVDILNPKFYSCITEEQLRAIFRSDNNVQIPLLKERQECLHQVGRVLIEKFNGSFEKVVREAQNSAVKLLNLIVTNFECFRDVATYKDNSVSLYKRAQILVGDVWACFRNRGLGYFEDIQEITMFADYRVPQTLLYFGVFEYSEKLKETLASNNLLKNGEEYEVEIRGCSIEAVERLKEYVVTKIDKTLASRVNSILIDHFLWDFRRKHAKEILDMKLPFHKTYSIYY